MLPFSVLPLSMTIVDPHTRTVILICPNPCVGCGAVSKGIEGAKNR